MACNASLHNKKILITCGPTWVPIDRIRVISNVSTGEIGHRISHLLCREKAKVTLIQGPGTHPLRHLPYKTISFRFFDEFAKVVKSELQKTKYDVVIHAAAVSDYKIRRPQTKKISSNFKEFKLELVPTPKIIQTIKKLNPKTFLIGFKLESEAKKEFLVARAETLIKKAKCDLVVANLATNNYYKGYIIDRTKTILATETSREKMAQHLVSILKEKL
ncbi:MAG: phosphopantothenoylcysteine decarboxylase [Candidatus Aceula meridiana]|nr:phosphopantothenoylcysteine decarboxylase [Candidatus Aceula meridiana]